MKKKINKKNLFLFAFLATLFIPCFVYAQNIPTEDPINYGLLWASTFGLPNVNLFAFISRLVRVFLAIVIVVVVLMILISGLKWMLAGEDEDKKKKARGAFINAIIGLIIIFAAYAITAFIIGALMSAAGGTPAI